MLHAVRAERRFQTSKKLENHLKIFGNPALYPWWASP